MTKRIVIVTDCTDAAYNELRGVIFKSLKDNGVQNITIEPVAAVKPFSLINGAFILRLMAEVYPPETIFLVVLNPMKQRPERIFGRTKKNNFLFIGANTGIFSWFLRDFGLEELYELHDPGFFPFGGKNRLEIKNAEVGMDKEVLSKLFQKLTQAVEVSQVNAVGTGLGLCVAK